MHDTSGHPLDAEVYWDAAPSRRTDRVTTLTPAEAQYVFGTDDFDDDEGWEDDPAIGCKTVSDRDYRDLIKADERYEA